MKDVYSSYWMNAREKIYGFSQYDKNLCEYLKKNVAVPAKLLEVGIGTGYPFADYLYKSGYDVYGIDISPDLIAKCSELYPNVKSKVGDAEALEYHSDTFDCVYCFHSTWYFPDLNKAIDEMLRVTRPGGLVLFDIQNWNNIGINSNYLKLVSERTGNRRIIRYFKNFLKIILRRGQPIWDTVVHETPTHPQHLFQHLTENNKHISNYRVMVKNEDSSLEFSNKLDHFENFGRVIFVILKR